MTNMTFAVPEDLHKFMRKHNEVKWSAVARGALHTHADKLRMMDELLANSELTEADVEMIGKQVKRAIARNHGLIK